MQILYAYSSYRIQDIYSSMIVLQLPQASEISVLAIVDFELSVASGASKYCEAVEFWMKTKMKIFSYEWGRRRE